MAQVTIGGTEYAVSLPNYKALKRAWKHLAPAQGSTDMVSSVDAIIGVIAVGLQGAVPGEPANLSRDEIEAFRVDFIEDHLTPTEMTGMQPFMNGLMVESGMADPQPDPA